MSLLPGVVAPNLGYLSFSNVFWRKIDPDKKKTGQHVPLRLFDGLLAMGLEAARVFEAGDRGDDGWSQEQFKWAQEFCGDRASLRL